MLFLGNGDAPAGPGAAPCGAPADGGRTWHKAELPCVPNSTVWGFAVHPADPQLILAYTVSGEIFTSRDGGLNWGKVPRVFGEIRALAWVPA